MGKKYVFICGPFYFSFCMTSWIFETVRERPTDKGPSQWMYVVVKKNPDHLEKPEGESPEIILIFFFIVTVKKN